MIRPDCAGPGSPGHDGVVPIESLPFDPDALREKYRIEREKRLRPEGSAQYLELDGDFAMMTTPAAMPP